MKENPYRGVLMFDDRSHQGELILAVTNNLSLAKFWKFKNASTSSNYSYMMSYYSGKDYACSQCGANIGAPTRLDSIDNGQKKWSTNTLGL